jgi:hypothetical protein
MTTHTNKKVRRVWELQEDTNLFGLLIHAAVRYHVGVDRIQDIYSVWSCHDHNISSSDTSRDHVEKEGVRRMMH